jgi:hypothetical protein
VSGLVGGSLRSTSVGNEAFVADVSNNMFQSLGSGGGLERRRENIAVAKDAWKISGQGWEAHD